jgi:hypothetical protein
MKLKIFIRIRKHCGSATLVYTELNFCADFLSELNRTYENTAGKDLPSAITAVPAVPPPTAVPAVKPGDLRGEEIHYQASAEDDEAHGAEQPEEVKNDLDDTSDGGGQDYGFKMPENFDIPQDYIQQIVPKRSLGNINDVLLGHIFFIARETLSCWNSVDNLFVTFLDTPPPPSPEKY